MIHNGDYPIFFKPLVHMQIQTACRCPLIQKSSALQPGEPRSRKARPCPDRPQSLRPQTSPNQFAFGEYRWHQKVPRIPKVYKRVCRCSKGVSKGKIDARGGRGSLVSWSFVHTNGSSLTTTSVETSQLRKCGNASLSFLIDWKHSAGGINMPDLVPTRI